MKGEAWFQDMPDDWSSASVKHLFDIQLGKMLQPEQQSPTDRLIKYLKAQHVQWHSVTTRDLPEMWASPKEISQYSVRNGDLLVCEGGEAGRGAVIQSLEEEAIIQNALHRVRSNKNDACFLEYVLHSVHTSGWFDVLCNKATIAHFTGEKFGAMRIPFPPPETQKLIASFLDRKTAAINTLIAKKQRLIQLLEEKRTALINQAVTKGLNPNAPMKDSGVPWIGEIPVHWEVLRLKFVLQRIVDCKNRTPIYVEDGEYGVVRTTNVRQGKFLFENLLKTDKSNYKEWTQREVPQPRHIIFTREAPAGEACKVPESPKICLGQRTMLFMPNDELITSDFLVLSIYGGGVDGFVKSASSGSTVSHLRVEQVGDLPIFLPPLQEQESIFGEVQIQQTKIESLVGVTKNSIKKLQEYQQSLITAAVTGKLDANQGKLLNP